jgi:hypothetical protein
MNTTRTTNLLSLVVGLTFLPVLQHETVAGQPKPPKEFSIRDLGNGYIEMTVKVNAACEWRIEAADEVTGPFFPTDLVGRGGRKVRLQIPADKPRQFFRVAVTFDPAGK